jgi:hypothetical protein
MLSKHAACLGHLPTVFAIPAAASFASDLAVYEWAMAELMPSTSTALLVGACHSWANYTCGWSDPLGVASIDYAVASRAMVVNLSPDTQAHPDQVGGRSMAMGGR